MNQKPLGPLESQSAAMRKYRGVIGTWSEQQLHDVAMWEALGEEFKQFMWAYIPTSIVQDSAKFVRLMESQKSRCKFGMMVCVKEKASAKQRKDKRFFESLMLVCDSIEIVKQADAQVLEDAHWCWQWMQHMPDGFEFLASPLSVMSATAQQNERLLERCVQVNPQLIVHSKLNLPKEKQMLKALIEDDGWSWFERLSEQKRSDVDLVWAYLECAQRQDFGTLVRALRTELVPASVWEHWNIDAKTSTRLQEGIGMVKYLPPEKVMDYVDMVAQTVEHIRAQRERAAIQRGLGQDQAPSKPNKGTDEPKGGWL